LRVLVDVALDDPVTGQLGPARHLVALRRDADGEVGLIAARRAVARLALVIGVSAARRIRGLAVQIVSGLAYAGGVDGE
jgi:hypothetical protein